MKKFFIILFLLLSSQFIFGQSNRSNQSILIGGWVHESSSGVESCLIFNDKGVNVFWHGDTWGVIAVYPYTYENNILTIRDMDANVRNNARKTLLECRMLVTGDQLVLLLNDGWMLFTKRQNMRIPTMDDLN